MLKGGGDNEAIARAFKETSCIEVESINIRQLLWIQCSVVIIITDRLTALRRALATVNHRMAFLLHST